LRNKEEEFVNFGIIFYLQILKKLLTGLTGWICDTRNCNHDYPFNAILIFKANRIYFPSNVVNLQNLTAEADGTPTLS